MLPDLRLVMGATVAIVVVAATGLATFVTFHTAYQTSADLQSSKPRSRPSADGTRQSAKVEGLAQSLSQAGMFPTDGSVMDESSNEQAASPSAHKLPNSALDRPEPPMPAAVSKQNADASPARRNKVDQSATRLASATVHESPRVHRRHHLTARSQPGYAARFEGGQPGMPQAAGQPGAPDNQANSHFSLFR